MLDRKQEKNGPMIDNKLKMEKLIYDFNIKK